MSAKSRESLYEFGPFVLDAERQTLLRHGRPVGLSPKAFETLRVLVEKHGELVTKQELINAVWPDVTVERGSLNLTIHLTRKSLSYEGESNGHYIETVPRRGYRFVATVRVTQRGIADRIGTQANPLIELGRTEPFEVFPLPFGGHASYVLTSSALFGSLFGISVFIQVAYEFNKYATTAVTVGSLAACAMFIVSALGFALDLKGMVKRPTRALPLHCFVLLAGAAGVFACVQRYLPASPVVRATFQTYTAQAAYLKDVSYFLALAFLFVVVPFNFISAAEREISRRPRCNVSRLLLGYSSGLPPKGTVYLKIPILIFFLLLLASVAMYAMVHLFNNLESAPYMNLYMQTIYTRWIVFFGLAVQSLTWYYRELNELKFRCQEEAE
jgi:DNA-binding winged helix-turn-helix (wHTH) protein